MVDAVAPFWGFAAGRGSYKSKIATGCAVPSYMLRGYLPIFIGE